MVKAESVAWFCAFLYIVRYKISIFETGIVVVDFQPLCEASLGENSMTLHPSLGIKISFTQLMPCSL